VKTILTVTVSAFALASLPAPASAQHAGHMPGMSMPGMTTPAKKKAAPKKAPPKKAAPKKTPVAKAKAAPPVATAEHDHAAPAGPASVPEEAVTPAPLPPETAPDHSTMDHPAMDPSAMAPMEMDHSTMDHGAHATMKGALGPYPMTREASGTPWQPDTSGHMGYMTQAGGWMLMGHGMLNLVYDTQGGRRGDDKAFVGGMLMGMAQRPIGDGTFQLKAMLSPEPLMGKRGYPLLLASGETANGTDRLIDRQHPHDLFMELSASVSQNIGPNSSVFLYAGLPGEPAFGPPAFMHREAIMDSPEAPITHHWLDSTHISFGVLTAGLVLDDVKVEVSRFNGREPDQHRYDIETGPLDSTAVRLSWNPTDTLSLQGSWGHFVDPEQLEPGVDQKRLSASALYAKEIAPGWKLATTLAWGRKTVEHHKDDAFAAEAALKHDLWTIFGRGELTENRELLDVDEHGPAFTVGKVSLGAIRDFRVAEHLTLGAGALVAANFIPDGLAPLYGGNNPLGAMGFLRLKIE
jgi:hypothetical protein